MGTARRSAGLLIAALLVVAGSLLASEFIARVALGLGPEEASAERADYAGRLPASTFESDTKDTRRIVQMAYGARFELHPFFGYTFARDEEGANGAGFHARGVEYPYEASPGEFVVGVFGGSVAMQVANAGEIIQRALLPIVAEKGYDRITILSFSVGGWRQPQSFHAFLRYLPTIDMALVVDGFNEVNHLSDHLMQKWPAEFPTGEIFFPLSKDSAYSSAEKGRTMLLNDWMAGATTAFEQSWLRDSVLAHLGWRILAARHHEEVGSTAAAKSEGYQQPEDPTAMVMGTPAGRVTSYYDHWADLVRHMDLIGTSEGKPVLHFIQPNQYDRGSKPLSEEERAEFIGANSFDHITPRYARIESMVEELSKEGVESHYLGDLFIEEEATVYSDSCCHFNDEGVRQLTEAVMAAVVASPRLEVIPAEPAARSVGDERG